MLGAYFGATVVYIGGDFWLAALAAGVGVGIVGIALERFIRVRSPAIFRARCW